MPNPIAKLTHPTVSAIFRLGFIAFIDKMTELSYNAYMELLGARHAWSERTPFTIHRPGGLENITFLHFDCEVELLSRDGRRAQAPHACIFYAPGEPQWFKCHKALVHDWVHFSPALLPLLKKAGIETNTVYRPKDKAFIGKIIRELELEYIARGCDCEELCYHKLREFIIKFGRAVREEPGMTLAGDKYSSLRSLRRELLTRCREPWTVKKMALLAGMSPSRFHAVYARAFGISPMEDMINERLHTAQNLLLSTDMSIAAVTEACGYESESHFIRQFRKRTGTSPGKYRKNNI